MACRLATVVAMNAPCTARLRARWAVTCVTLSSTLVPARKPLATKLPTRHGPDVAALVFHLPVAAQALPRNKLAAERMIAQVAASRAEVAARLLLSADSLASWRPSTADHGRVDVARAAGARERLVRHDPAWAATTQVAEVLAEVAAAGQRLSTDLEAHVDLVTPVVEARAADGVAAVIPASLLRLADLSAHHFVTFAAQDLALRSSTSARFSDLLPAITAQPLVARPRALVPAVLVPLPTALPTQRQRVGAP